MKTTVFHSPVESEYRIPFILEYAIRLTDAGKKVFILDSSLPSAGLQASLVWERFCKEKLKRGLLDYILFYQDVGQASCEIRNYVVPVKFSTNPSECNLMPARSTTDSKEQITAKILGIDWKKLFPEKGQSAGMGLLLHLRDLIYNSYCPDHFLVDVGPGINDLSNVLPKSWADTEVEVLSVRITDSQMKFEIRQTINKFMTPHTGKSHRYTSPSVMLKINVEKRKPVKLIRG